MEFTPEGVLEGTALPDRVRREIPRVVNRLLGETFLYQEDEAGKEDYYLVYRHRAVFKTLLALSGFTLLHDDYHRIFQVVSEWSYCRERYKLDETLMITVLRKLYEQQVEHLSLAGDPVVTVGEVREEYRTITGKERALGIEADDLASRSITGIHGQDRLLAKRWGKEQFSQVSGEDLDRLFICPFFRLEPDFGFHGER